MIIDNRIKSNLEYRTCLADWDSLAVVRARPRRLLQDEEAMGKVYFSTRLIPYLLHPLVTKLGPAAQRALAVHHLYHYLDFTANFEIEVVNRQARRIALGKTGIALRPEMLFDAYKIYCDEAYHSFFSVDVKLQVEAATGIKPLPYDFNQFMRRLNKAREGVPAEMRKTSGLLTVIVFETLISMILNQIPKDDQVVGTIRQMVSDHADDEAKHHAFFSQLLDALWPQLSRADQAVLGPLLPHFIIRSLEPDYDSIAQRLAALDLGPEEIRQVIEESYPPARVIAGLRKTAFATLRLFERNGVFEDSRTFDAFNESGLLG
ncbi:MAG TPA: diiron oxygenase [Blastocatellia bacterium]|nr:diiron oxygenase [Blastocatellia bacterium]